MFKNAMAHVQRNYRALLIFFAILTLYFALQNGLEFVLKGSVDFKENPSAERIYLLVVGISSAAIFSLAQTFAFTRMGTDIDRPRWKPLSTGQVMLRFFTFWFTLNFINTAALLLIAISLTNQDSQVSLELLRRIYEILIVPFGATVMFYGNTSRQEIAEAMTTFVRQLPQFMLLALFSLVLQSLMLVLQSNLPLWAFPLLSFTGAYFDCFLFAYAWEICLFNREELEHPDDVDF